MSKVDGYSWQVETFEVIEEECLVQPFDFELKAIIKLFFFLVSFLGSSLLAINGEDRKMQLYYSFNCASFFQVHLDSNS